MGLFKNGDELYDQAIDLIGRKNFPEAISKFQKALEKGCAKEAHARFCMALMYMDGRFGDPSSYKHLGDILQKLPAGPVAFGVTSADRDLMIAQTELAVQEIAAQNMSDSDFMAKGQALLEAAAGFAGRIGQENLPIQDLLKGTSTSGNREALVLQAMAYEVMGKGAVYADPKQGSEYLQMAYNFRKQLGDSGDEDLRLMRQFATTGHCWLCGRQVAGEGVHFMAVRSDISDMFRKKEDGEAIKATSSNYGSIFMCMPCYTAVSNRADEISVRYYNDAIAQMRAMEARLQAEISSLRVSMSFANR